MPEETVQEDVQPDADLLEFPADPMQSIRDEDYQRESDEMETALAKLTGVGEQPAEGGNVTETVEGTSDKDTAPKASVKRAPIDKVLAKLRDSNLTPEEQEAIKATIATNTRLQQEAAGIDSRIEKAVQDAIAEAMKEEQDDTVVADDPLLRVTDQQKRIFDQLAKEMGYVKRQDLDAKAAEQTREQYLTSGREAALADFGDAFGMKDTTGQLVLGDGVQERLAERYKPIQDHGTLTLHDLYLLTYHKDLLEQAKADGVEEGRNMAQGRRVERQKGRTEARTSGIGIEPRIRGEKGTAQDSSENVFGRAVLLAKRKLREAS